MTAFAALRSEARANRVQTGFSARRFRARARAVIVVSFFVLTLLASFFTGHQAGAQTAGGGEPIQFQTVGNIDFQFRVTYRYSMNIVSQVMSNRVRLAVLAHRDVSLVPGGNRAVMPGGQATFAYTLTNKGNVVDTFHLQHTFPAGTGIVGTWWYDLDGNGRLSSGDVQVTDTNGDGVPDTGPISPGATRRLLLVASVPSSAAIAVHPVEARAVSQSDAAKLAVAANVLQVTDSAPYITVDEAPVYAYEGQTFTLPIEYGNTGASPVQATAITAPLSPYVTYVSSSPAGVYNAESHSVTWSMSQIPGDSAQYIYLSLLAGQGHGVDKTIAHKARLEYSGGLVLEARANTQLATRAPALIHIVADPNVIRADGRSISRLTAAITDMVGNGVEEGLPVTFRTPQGTLVPVTPTTVECTAEVAQGDVCLVVPAQDGLARADLISPLNESNEHTVVPITVSAWNPDTGLVRERLNIYFSPGAIVGRLINVETGHPEAGVEVRLVRLDDNGNPIGTPTLQFTDENGYYIFPVPEGDYKLVVTRNTERGKDSFDLPKVEVREAFDVVTFPPITIRGRLLDRATGEGLPHALVDLFDENGILLGSTTTDARGDYVFSVTEQTLIAAQAQQGMSPQGVGISPMSAGGVSLQNVSPLNAIARPTWRVRARTNDGRGADASVRDVRPGDMVVNLNLTVEPLGLVIDASTGRPVPGASVSLVWAGPPYTGDVVILPLQHNAAQPNPTATDADGIYHFQVTPGYYKLVVNAPGYQRYESEPMIIQGDQVAMMLYVQPLGSDQVSIAKEALRPFSRPGEQISYLLHVTNLTSQTLAAVDVEDQLPADLSYVADSANHAGSYDAVTHTLAWRLENIGPGRTVVVHYDVTVGAAVPAGTVLTNNARAQVDGDPTFATASAETQVANWADIKVTKRSDQKEASIGDVVRYEVVVENRSEATDAFSVAVEDTLPVGFAYVPGSTRIDGASAPDPAKSGRTLVWPLGDMPGETAHTVTYAAVVALGAANSDGVNVAYALGEADSGHAFRLGPGTAYVRVQDGLFGHLGRVVGRVYVDVDGSGRPDSGEPGLRGVEVVLDDGRRVVTGEHGFFSFEGVAPGVRSLKLVATSLPHGFGADGSDRGGDASAFAPAKLGGWSQFAQVRPSATSMIDFPVLATSEAYLASLTEAAPLRGADILADAVAAVRAQYEAEASAQAGVEIGTQAGTQSSAVAGSATSRPAAATLPRITAPEPFYVSYRRLTTVSLEGRAGQPLQLYSNGVAVPDSQIGRRVENPREGRLDLTYYGVELHEGVNTLTAVSGSSSHSIQVVVVGRPAQVEIVAVPSSVPYRTQRLVPVTLLVTDALGLPVEDGTTLTFHAQGAKIQNRDVNTTQPGTQLRTEDGMVELMLVVEGRYQGDVVLQASASEREWSLPVETHFLPEPRLLVGSVDVQIPLAGDVGAHATGSVYFREAFEGGWRIGARYDNRKSPLGERPANGLPPMTLRMDTSVVDDLAPSRDRFYLMVERHDSYVLYGDYSPARGNSNRFTQRAGRATGFESTIVTELGTLSAYSFTQRTAAERSRLAAKGVAGLYYLDHADLLPGTEELWIVAYDPEDDGFLDPRGKVRLQRGADYEIDYRSGIVTFTEPVPTYNEHFHRMYVEASYAVPSVNGDGSAFGLRYELPDLGVGRHTFTYAGESGPGAGRPVVGVDGQFALGFAGGTFRYEHAEQGATAGHAAGRASAVQLSLQPTHALRVNVRAQNTAGEYVRPGDEKALTTGFNLQSGADVRISERVQLRYERTYAQGNSGSPRHTDQLQVPFTLTSTLTGAVSLRSSGVQAEPWGDERAVTLGLTGEVKTSEHGRLSVRQDYALQATSLRAAPTTITYRHQLGQAVAASLRFQGGAKGAGALDGAWLLSIESTPRGGPQLYGRYQFSDRGRDKDQAVMGFRNRWELVPGFYAGLTAERVTTPATGDVKNAGSWQLEYVLGPQLRVLAQQERRSGSGPESGTNRLQLDGRTPSGYAYELRASWHVGGQTAADGRAYRRELQGQLTYRDPVAGRGFATGQLVQRTFTTAASGSFTRKESEVTVAAAEAGYRVTHAVTLTGKVAVKRTATDWNGNPGEAVGVDLALQQLGAQVQLGERHSLDLYARRLTDNFGSEISGYAWELTHMLSPDLGLGLGYSSIGTDDPDVRLVADWQSGWYMRARLKF